MTGRDVLNRGYGEFGGLLPLLAKLRSLANVESRLRARPFRGTALLFRFKLRCLNIRVHRSLVFTSRQLQAPSPTLLKLSTLELAFRCDAEATVVTDQALHVSKSLNYIHTGISMLNRIDSFDLT